MIIPADGDADLLIVLSRLSSCYTNLNNLVTSRSILPMTVLSAKNVLCSAIGNSCE